MVATTHWHGANILCVSSPISHIQFACMVILLASAWGSFQCHDNKYSLVTETMSRQPVHGPSHTLSILHQHQHRHTARSYSWWRAIAAWARRDFMIWACLFIQILKSIIRNHEAEIPFTSSHARVQKGYKLNDLKALYC